MNYKTNESPCTLTTIGSTGLVYRKTWIKSVESLQVTLKKVYFPGRVSPEGGSTGETDGGVDTEDRGLLELSSTWVFSSLVHVHSLPLRNKRCSS